MFHTKDTMMNYCGIRTHDDYSSSTRNRDAFAVDKDGFPWRQRDMRGTTAAGACLQHAQQEQLHQPQTQGPLQQAMAGRMYHVEVGASGGLMAASSEGAFYVTMTVAAAVIPLHARVASSIITPHVGFHLFLRRVCLFN